MNIRKGFFRLTLVVSIILGILTPFCQEWYFKSYKVTIYFPDNWGKVSLQEKLNSIDVLLSNKADYFLLPRIEQSNIRRQLKERIISDAKLPPNKPQGEIVDPAVKKLSDLINETREGSFSFKPGWRELSLLVFIGFISPWLIYLFIRWVIVAFIIGGFKTKS
ncbi:MAG: hypothetical protein A2V86_15580 [Deltaproteobacteria bacterium RBG_16_49_23]|nr:MAG: hypothetical protein A2V86_15580 [Deltaproteobacteria bacterium RBG_16_49_23]